jgi:hypothetical protein
MERGYISVFLQRARNYLKTKEIRMYVSHNRRRESRWSAARPGSLSQGAALLAARSRVEFQRERQARPRRIAWRARRQYLYQFECWRPGSER